MSLPRFRLTLAALPGDPPPEIRLRRLLKIALRVCRLRAVEVADLSSLSWPPDHEDGEYEDREAEYQRLSWPPEPEDLTDSDQADQDAREKACTGSGDAIGEITACAFCGEALTKKRRAQRFCSTDCRMRAHGRLMRRPALEV